MKLRELNDLIEAAEEPFSVWDAAGKGIANTLSGASDAIERGRNAYIGGSVADQTHPNKGNGLEIADRTGKRTKYVQSGDKWLTQDGKEVDPAMAAMLSARAAQQATATTTPATTATTPTATTPTATPATTATTPTATTPTTTPATAATSKPTTAPNFTQKSVMPNNVTYNPNMLAKPAATSTPAATTTAPAKAPNFNALSTMMNKPLAIPTPKTTAPAATTQDGKPHYDPATGKGAKYDGVTGQPTPAWQAELDKQDAAAKAKAAALPQLGAPPAQSTTTTPAPTATAQADIGKPGFQQSKLKNQTVPSQSPPDMTKYFADRRAANLAQNGPATTAPATDANMDAAEQALLAKMQAKNPKLAPVAESRVDFGAMLFKRMKSGR